MSSCSAWLRLWNFGAEETYPRKDALSLDGTLELRAFKAGTLGTLLHSEDKPGHSNQPS